MIIHANTIWDQTYLLNPKESCFFDILTNRHFRPQKIWLWALYYKICDADRSTHPCGHPFLMVSILTSTLFPSLFCLVLSDQHFSFDKRLCFPLFLLGTLIRRGQEIVKEARRTICRGTGLSGEWERDSW